MKKVLLIVSVIMVLIILSGSTHASRTSVTPGKYMKNPIMIRNWVEQATLKDYKDLEVMLTFMVWTNENLTGSNFTIEFEPWEVFYSPPPPDLAVVACDISDVSPLGYGYPGRIITDVCNYTFIPNVQEELAYSKRRGNFTKYRISIDIPIQGEEYDDREYVIEISYLIKDFIEKKGPYYIARLRTTCYPDIYCPIEGNIEKVLTLPYLDTVLKTYPQNAQISSSSFTDTERIYMNGYDSQEIWFTRLSETGMYIPLFWAFIGGIIGAVIAIILENLIKHTNNGLQMKEPKDKTKPRWKEVLLKIYNSEAVWEYYGGSAQVDKDDSLMKELGINPRERMSSVSFLKEHELIKVDKNGTFKISPEGLKMALDLEKHADNTNMKKTIVGLTVVLALLGLGELAMRAEIDKILVLWIIAISIVISGISIGFYRR